MSKRFLRELILGLLAITPGLLNAEDAKTEDLKDEDLTAQIDLRPFFLTRADALPVEGFESATDPYLEGYIQALIDANYNEFKVIVSVRDHKVFLYNLPKNELIANSIISFVKDIPGVQSVDTPNQLPPEEEVKREIYTERPEINGIWFPQSTVLFLPLIADPREPMYYAAYRNDDHVIGQNVIAVALGDEFPIFRWHNVFKWKGDMQIGISAGIWAVFNFSNIPHNDNGDVCELVNTDYFLGFPLTYAVDRWSFRLRPYHISSHLGDEFLVNNPSFLTKRKNPSFEALEFIGSYQASQGLRLYGGPGWVFHSDDSFPLKPFYIKWGTELRLFGKKFFYHRLYGTPFFAMNLENWQQHQWEFNTDIMLGYELSKMQGVGRKMRIFIMHHQGYSYEGQFFNKKTNYSQAGISWGF